MKIKSFVNFLLILLFLIHSSLAGGPGDHDCDPFVESFVTVIDAYIANITTATEVATDELLHLNSSFFELPERDFDIRASEIESACTDILLNATSHVLNAAQILTNSNDNLLLDLFMGDTKSAPYPLSCLEELIKNVHDMLYDSMEEISAVTQEIKSGHVPIPSGN